MSVLPPMAVLPPIPISKPPPTPQGGGYKKLTLNILYRLWRRFRIIKDFKAPFRGFGGKLTGKQNDYRVLAPLGWLGVKKARGAGW